MPRFCANLSMLFTELPFLDRFEVAAAARFKGVEYLFPYNFCKAAIRERLDRFGLKQVLFNMPPGDWNGGERGLAILPDRVDEFRDGVASAVDWAQALDCDQIHCMAGIMPVGSDPQMLRETYIGNLKFAADAFSKAGLKLLIEPINTRDMPGYFLSGTEQALDIIAETGKSNIGLQYDCYHMQIMEGDLCPTIERHLDQIAHVQAADTPGRHEPGTGEINYPFVFQHLDRIGYQGWIGCEYHPSGTAADGLGWLKPYITT